MSPVTIRTQVTIVLLLLVSLSPHATAPAAAAQGTVSPVLLRASAAAPTSSLLVVTGHGFTPGGLVHLAIYDHWGVEHHAHVWTTASPGIFGPNGSADPALHYLPAGTIQESIDLFPPSIHGANGSQDPALGYSASLDTVQASAAIYGPNGSQDPALGHVPGTTRHTGGMSCERSLMVRAYDAEASTWSNMIDATLGC